MGEVGEADCIFCRIARKEVTADVIFEDEDLLAFRDIRPDAEIHIQLIPKRHITNVNSLTSADGDFIYSLWRKGREIIKEALGPDRQSLFARAKFGFHVPPFNSVHHLHLHCMAGRFTFASHFTHGALAPWFRTLPELLHKLRIPPQALNQKEEKGRE